MGSAVQCSAVRDADDDDVLYWTGGTPREGRAPVTATPAAGACVAGTTRRMRRARAPLLLQR